MKLEKGVVNIVLKDLRDNLKRGNYKNILSQKIKKVNGKKHLRKKIIQNIVTADVMRGLYKYCIQNSVPLQDIDQKYKDRLKESYSHFVSKID